MSSIDTNALLKASGIGAAIAVVLSVISQVISYFFSPGMMTPSDAAALAGPLMIVSACLCCVGYGLYAAVGVGYAFFAQRNDTPMDVGLMALGGGLSAVIVSVISSVIGLISLLVFGSQAVSESMAELEAMGAEVPVAPMLAGGLIGVVIGFCIAFVASAALGAGGGAIYAAVVKPKDTAV